MEKQGKNKISLKKILNIVVIIGAFLGFSGILIAVLSVVAHFVIKNDDLMNIICYSYCLCNIYSLYIRNGLLFIF